jgi:PAS domain S-box-containing protein
MAGLMAERTPEQLLRLLEGQSRVLEMTAQSAPLASILDELMRVIEQQAEGMLCSVLLLTEDRRHVRHGAAPSLPERYNATIEGGEIGPCAGSCGTAAFLRKQVIVTDIEHDPLWTDWKDVALGAGLRACWSTPIFSSSGEVLGTFAMYYHEPAGPSRIHFNLIGLATHLAQVAIERDLAVREHERLLSDVTAQKAHLQAVIDQMPIGVTIADRTGTLVAFNRSVEEHFGHPAVFSQSLGDYVSWNILRRDGRPADPEQLPMARALNHGETVTGEEYVVVRGDGTRVTMSFGGAPLRASDGSVSGAVGVSWDVTQQKKVEQALLEADQRKNEFLGVLSHELRNPLASIAGSIYVLERVPGDGAQARSARGVIQRQTAHLGRIVDDLLDVTRISRGKIELDCKQIDLREVVLQACEDHRSMFEEGEVELRQELPASPKWIRADRTRISQVLGNLLQNAAKFTPAHGTVTVAVADRDGRAEMSVRDTGIGMRPAVLEHLFEPFAQGEQGLARAQGGLGLGLALSKGLTELHGGSLRAQSDGPGRGSEFRLLLPLAPSPTPPIHAAAPTAGERAGGRLVLLIEDNLDACASLALALELSGHQVRTAHDGRTGIAAAHELKPDLVLCDLGLPDIDGFEVGRRLREDETLRSTRLVALSGYARPEDKARAREAGFDAHMAKPAEPDVLAQMLANQP